MTDHDRLWGDLDAVMNGERSATILREWIDRLRSNGPDGLRVVPVDAFAGAVPLDVNKVYGAMPEIEVSTCGFGSSRASEKRLFRDAGIDDTGGERD